jgi:nitrogen regulatory protein P-II 1
MKKIEAIIRPENFEKVKSAMEEAGYDGVTLTEVEGQGRQKGLDQQFKGYKFKVEFLPKLKMEVVAVDKDVPKIIQAILGTKTSGQSGDGKIFVYSVEEAYRIRDGEKGEKAVS